jgi:type IV pilus assembly protein PilX
MTPMKHVRAASRQRGAALVIGLLLLVILTLLAISGMNTASLELVIAGNGQYRQNAFQAAETGIAQALSTGNFNPQAAPVTAPQTAVGPEGEKEFFKTKITPQLDGQALPAIGKSGDRFQDFHFEIQSVGTSARNATATSVQGVAVVGLNDGTFTPVGEDSELK